MSDERQFDFESVDGVVVYGSLLEKEQIFGVFGDRVSAIPVKVEGYQRCFNQRSDYRDPENGSVMNVVNDSNSWINAILVYGFDNEDLESYVSRESGYTFERVPIDSVRGYEGVKVPELSNVQIAVGDLQLEKGADFRPIPDYVTECLDGARDWGDAFVADFLFTTNRWPTEWEHNSETY